MFYDPTPAGIQFEGETVEQMDERDHRIAQHNHEVQQLHQDWAKQRATPMPAMREWAIKHGLALILLLGLCSCSHLTVAPKPVNAHAIAFSGNKQNAGIIDCDTNGCLVDTNFIAKYKQMELQYKRSIAEDVNIKKEGNNYRVSYEIISHFTLLKAAERGT